MPPRCRLPRYAPLAAALAPLANRATRVLQRPLGFAARPLPRWRRDYFRDTGVEDGDVLLFVDTFNRYFEPENAHAAKAVLEAAGYRVQVPAGLCCGRTFLSVGMVDQARREAQRMLEVLGPLAARGVPIVGLEHGQARSAAHARGAGPTRRAWRADRRPRAPMPLHAA